MPDGSQHWSDLLTPQLTEAFYIGYGGGAINRRASLIGNLYGQRDSQRAFEEHLGVGVFSTEGWTEFRKTRRVHYDERNKGYTKRYTHVTFVKGFQVERELVEDNLTEVITDDATELGDSAFRKREISAASVFVNAFTDSGTNIDGLSIAGPDGVGLCSLVHPRSSEDNATQANEGTLSLTADNVGTTRVAMMQFTDDRGGKLDVMPDQIMVPPELEDTALKIVRSSQDPASANNAINPQASRFTVLPWHYLSDSNAWFMMDAARRSRMLLWYDRVPLEFGREEDFDTLQAKYRAYMRYSYGWKGWEWIYGQNPS